MDGHDCEHFSSLEAPPMPAQIAIVHLWAQMWAEQSDRCRATRQRTASSQKHNKMDQLSEGELTMERRASRSHKHDHCLSKGRTTLKNLASAWRF